MLMKRSSAARESFALSLISAAMIAVFAFLSVSGFTPAVKGAAYLSAGLAVPASGREMIKAAVYKNKNIIPDFSVNESPAVNGSVTVDGEQTENTPADISEMAMSFRQIYANSAHDGAIVEKQYNSENATDIFGNICVRNTTPSHSVNIEASLGIDTGLRIEDASKPTVLIYHTHTTESYEMLDEGWFTNDYSTRSQDPARNMVRVGDAICEELEKSGIGVIHDREIHDLRYTGAYDRSRETLVPILESNPTVLITVDVHRDAIHQNDSTRIKPTALVNGKKAAQVMIIAGCEDGKVSSFPNWETNLAFDLQFQQTAENLFPGLMRPVLFSARKYNMDLTPYSALFEFGSDSNTLEEAEYSGHLIGQALAEFIKEHTQNG